MVEMSVDAMDRISELPPFIIHQIMSYLSAEEVARTSILSKTWNRLHASFPILDFDLSYFLGKPDEIFCQSLGKFMEFVDVSLLRFGQLDLCIQKFRLSVVLLDVDKSPSRVDNWIRLAVEYRAKEIDLEVIADVDHHKVYTLPQTIFSAKLMTMLRLSGCRLEQPSAGIELHSLKKLTLHGVLINQQMAQKLVSKCPLLEDLCFSFCRGLDRLCVSEAPKLKSVIIYLDSDELEIIKIVVPSLQQLTLECQKIQNPNLSPLVLDLGYRPHLKMLKLSGLECADEEFVSKFPFLEELFFVCCKMFERIKISSRQLKSLKFSFCTNIKKLVVDTPNLLSFDYENCQLPSTFSINAPCTWAVSFVSEFNNVWCLKLREFLGAANKIKDLAIYVSEDMSSFNLEKFRERCGLPTCHVECLTLHIGQVPESDHKILLDGVLCICYPESFSVETMGDGRSRHVLFKWLYNEMKSTEMNCCNESHVKCWRHYLKHIETASFWRRMDRKLFDGEDLMKLLNVNNFMDMTDAWSNLPGGQLRFQLDWY